MAGRQSKAFDAEDFRSRAARVSADDASVAAAFFNPGREAVEDFRDHGDHRLNPDLVDMLAGQTLRAAAVLIPVIEDGAEARVILTRRARAMRQHSGQVAFPGGAIDPTDVGPEDAAMREADEEIGLARGYIEPVGRLPDYLTTTGFRITPVLALVRPGFSIAPNPAEVDAVFDVPLNFLMDPANHQRESRIWEGCERHYYVMPYQDHQIWGVTAGIIRTLYERLYA